MPINPNDGQFALDCWRSEDDEADENTVYSDVIVELEEEAARYIKAGHYQYLELSRWNPGSEDWDLIRSYEPE
jgi:hypothetical protein